MLKKLYDRVMALAGKRNAIWWLAGVSFAESAFFPIPPDIMLVPMVLANRRRAWRIAGVCTLASVLGGLLGYAIGLWLFDSVGQPLLEFYGSEDKFSQFQDYYNEWGGWIVGAGGFTPLPYKVISIASGVTVWSLYECLTLWAWANGHIPGREWGDSPVYLAAMLVVVFFWGTAHFYANHRLLHWDPLYFAAHELHHRNANTGPWTGISMHPIEHVVYFSVFLFWWVVPAHPVVFMVTGFFNGISPSVTHSGFDELVLGGRFRLTAGDQFHHLHHRYFEVNYGNTPTPIDKLFDTWHDGTPESHATMRGRRKEAHGV